MILSAISKMFREPKPDRERKYETEDRIERASEHLKKEARSTVAHSLRLQQMEDIARIRSSYNDR